LNRYTFPRKLRLIKTDEFSSVFNFRKRLAGSYLIIHYQFNQLNNPRLGLVVGKKTARLSVDRNYMRRVIRQLFRVHQYELDNIDLVIRVQKAFYTKDYLVIEQEFKKLVTKFCKLRVANRLGDEK
jgi:ribonuclease P protein component